MRTPKRRHQPTRERGVPPIGSDLQSLAAGARYVPSAEHKDQFGPAGIARLRSDATRCPRDITEERARTWLQEAIAAGDVGGIWDAQPYPQLVWKRVGDTVFEGRVSNAEQGWYHGYPLDATEWPRWLE